MGRIFESVPTADLANLCEKLTSGYGKAADATGIVGATLTEHTLTLDVRIDCRIALGAVTDELVYRAAQWEAARNLDAKEYRSYI